MTPPRLRPLPGSSTAVGAHASTTTDAFLHAPTREAIVGTGRKRLLIAGVATEIIVQHSALSGAGHGFDVQVVVDACGGLSARTEEAALRRLVQAGVVTTSMASLAGQLAGDFTAAQGRPSAGHPLRDGRGLTGGAASRSVRAVIHRERGMKLLAIIDVAATADVSEIRAQLARELEASWALFAKGILREAYATEAPTRVVFVLEAGDRTQAEAQLRRLPLIASGSFSSLSSSCARS